MTTNITAEHVVRGRNGQEIAFQGRLLAAASSAEPGHTHRGDFAPAGWRCGSCRWFEVAIYAVDRSDDDEVISVAGEDGEVAASIHERDARYVVHTVGRSVIPGEIDFARVEWAHDADRVLDLLVLQQRGRRPKLPDASAEALDIAAQQDDTIDAAYERWLDAGVK